MPCALKPGCRQVNAGEYVDRREALRRAGESGCLHAIVVCNTPYMGLALDELRSAGLHIFPDDVERLSPLVHHHIHLDGRYHFSLPEPLTRGQLRPLRDPN